jgi:hypothetical protein
VFGRAKPTQTPLSSPNYVSPTTINLGYIEDNRGKAAFHRPMLRRSAAPPNRGSPTGSSNPGCCPIVSAKGSCAPSLRLCSAPRYRDNRSRTVSSLWSTTESLARPIVYYK